MKTVAASQMSWMLARKFAWESPENNGSLADEYITRSHIYMFEPPHIDSDGVIVAGQYVVTG